MNKPPPTMSAIDAAISAPGAYVVIATLSAALWFVAWKLGMALIELLKVVL